MFRVPQLLVCTTTLENADKHETKRLQDISEHWCNPTLSDLKITAYLDYEILQLKF